MNGFIKDLSEQDILNKLKGIKRTTGQHPGGLLVSLANSSKNDNKIIEEKNENLNARTDYSFLNYPIIKHSPLNYPADDKKSEYYTPHLDYTFLNNENNENSYLKLDLLGHNEPTVLYELQKLTKFKIKDIDFNDKRVMEIFTQLDVLGIPEFGTTFNEKNFLSIIKPNKFSQLIQISGLSHGTDVWLGNQKELFGEKKLDWNELISCREDVWKLFIYYGISPNKSFIASEAIRKGKWLKMLPEIKKEIEEKLSKDEKGKIYLSILEKVRYLFPKAHAIAYTMNAWRTSYYKVYYPEEFYSVLLTNHTTVYDIWLMSLEKEKIVSRIKTVISEIGKYKTREKEALSLIKVINLFFKELKRKKKELDKNFKYLKEYDCFNFEEKKKELEFRLENLKEIEENISNVWIFIKDFIDKKNEEKNNNSKELKNENLIEKNVIDSIDSKIENEIFNREEMEKIYTIYEKNKSSFFSSWKITSKEIDLLFSLKVMAEADSRLRLKKVFDFNKSCKEEFKIENGVMFFPISSIPGMGDAVSEEIDKYREKKIKDGKGAIEEWEKELKDILNTNQMNTFLQLKKINLIV